MSEQVTSSSFDAGEAATWKVHETIRKVFVINN